MENLGNWKELYLKVLSEVALPENRMRWYMVWVERFEKFLPEKPLTARTNEDFKRFLSEP